MNTPYRELLIGCGHRREKMMGPPTQPEPTWHELYTADINPNCGADFLCDLEITPWSMRVYRDMSPEKMGPIRLDGFIPNDSFDEVHAYEVLEHLGRQGEAHSFFAHFSEIWRILKPGGYLCASVPSRYSAWLWGDPSHRRAILPETLVFLSQDQYIKQCDGGGGRRTPMTDFRGIYKADFEVVGLQDNHQQMLFGLKAIKPSRIPDRFR